MNLIDTLVHWNNDATAPPLVTFFDAMGMPVPAHGQFTRTTDKGALIFLNDPACVLRITHDALYGSVRHPAVLQPLYSRMAGPFRAEIFPGVIAPATTEDVIKTAWQLMDDNIEFPNPREIREDNFGYIPALSAEHPRGIPVLIDMGAMADRRPHLARSATIPDHQTEFYAPAKDAFAAAWPADTTWPDPLKLKRAWQQCAQMKQEKRLHADWLTPGRFYGDFKNAKSGSINYAAACHFSA